MAADAIIAVLAEVGRTPVERVTPEARLGDIGLGTSLTLGVLRTRLQRQFGVDLGKVDWRTTVAELLARAAGARPAAAPSVAVRSAAAPARAAAAIGLDVQEIAALPGDPADAFYSAHFTAGEMATARERPDWREHLCGVWCAKEAAKKAIPALVNAPFTSIEVRHTAAGAPALYINGTASAAALSISHTGTVAAAVVVLI